MVLALIDVWCAASPRARFLCWCGWTLVLCGLAVFCLPEERLPGADALLRQREANRVQWLSLHRLAASAEPPLVARSKGLPFSPLAFQTPDARLVHWQPAPQGGEMALQARWQAIPPLFVRLAERDMRVSRFSLEPDGAEIRLTLQLEYAQ